MEDDPVQLTVQVLREAIEGRVVHRNCPFCDSDEWLSNEDRILTLVPHVVQNGRFVPTGERDLAIAFYCGNCGFARIHVPTTVGEPRRG
jgi:hypothetical protein